MYRIQLPQLATRQVCHPGFMVTGQPYQLILTNVKLTPPPVAIGAALPLIFTKLIQQFKSGEYVDFAELLPARGRPSQWHANRMSTLEILQLWEVERPQKFIPDFMTWTQCFALYTAVLGTD